MNFKANKFLAIIALFFFVVIMGSCGGGGGGGDGGGTGPTPPPTSENFTLSVDKFGEGVIVSDLSGINCGNDCSESYPSGTTVALTATANTGYIFNSWSGCDSTAGNTCTITMNSDRTVFPTFALSEVKLQAKTKILDDATMQHLVKQEASIYYFDSQATAVKDLQAGDVIVSGSGQGLLRRVVGVSILPDGLIAVETTDATLEDAIERGTIALTEKLTYAILKSSKALIKGVRLLKPIDKRSVDFTIAINSIIYDADSNENTTWDQVKVIGSATTSFEPDFAVTISWGIQEFKSVLITKTTQNLSVVAGGSIPLIDIKKPIKTFYFDPIVVIAPTPLGPLPVVFVPEVTVYVGIKGEAGATLSTKVTMEAMYTAGVYYRKGEGWRPVSNYSRNFGFDPPSISAGAYIKGYISPDFKIFLYDTAGPFASMEGYLKLEAGVSSPPWWRLYGGMGASAGAKVEIISWTLAEYRVDLFNLEWEIASSATQNQSPVISSVTANPSTVNPNGTSTVTCSASDPDGDPLTYSWTKTGGSISGLGSTVTWTAPSTTGIYTVTCSVSDGKTSVSKGVNITVTEPTTPLSITTTSLLSGTVGVLYGTNLSATGGKTPYTWSIMSGNLPFGLSLGTGGLISGTPTTSGTYNFTVQVKDSSSPQQSDSKALSIVILSAQIPTPDPPTPTSPGSSTEPGPTINTLTPTLQWSGVSNADYYALAISKYPYGSSNIVYNPQKVYGTSITVPSGTLVYGEKYRWNMQAHNSAGWSSVSNTLYFQTYK